MNKLDGNKIKSRRQDLDMTQKEVAAGMNMNDKTYARKEKDGDFSYEEQRKLVEILRISSENLTVEVRENNQAVNHGPPIEELIRSKDETINALKEHITFLKGENQRLRTQCETSLTGLHRYAQIVSARIQTMYESHKFLRAAVAKPEKKKIDAVGEELDRLYSAILQDTIQSDKD